jgi:lipopolysaccharide biosynthesis protein
MVTRALQLSEQSTITLPAELARQAGLEEGEVEVILGEHSLTVVSTAASTGYTARWEAIQAVLREQGAQFDLYQEDRRDAAYWEIVTPLFEEAERILSSI